MSISRVVFPLTWPPKLQTLAKPTARVIAKIGRGGKLNRCDLQHLAWLRSLIFKLSFAFASMQGALNPKLKP